MLFLLNFIFNFVYKSWVVRIDLLYFLSGCRKWRLTQALSVLSVSLGFLVCLLCWATAQPGPLFKLCYLLFLSLSCSC